MTPEQKEAFAAMAFVDQATWMMDYIKEDLHRLLEPEVHEWANKNGSALLAFIRHHD